MAIETLPFAELCRWIAEGEAAIHALPLHSGERAMRIVALHDLRARLPLYAEYRWQVRAWCARKLRRNVRHPNDGGPTVA